ncbi:MAG: HAD hydrolase-like protein [Patescibacteria group bacterium]|nr:HAD hydrolase-like protein [Patescibacteria group bacterium]MDD4304293.1 HAD hydrolase-like protein [Patescibacteria group bacterium]MDD4695680.1 HAD hydrolase-like protein [Patescibacteria group bacterium]
MIKNIIFDWSGVINDSAENNLLVTNEILKEFGAREISIEEFKNTWEQPYIRFYNIYLPNITVEEVRNSYKKYFLKYLKAKLYPKIDEVIKDFKTQGLQMAILSSDLPEILLSEMKSFGLENEFVDMIADAHDKSEGLKDLIKRNNFKIEETIFIGDSNHEIQEGKIVGVKTGAVTWGFSTKERLESLKPDFLINNLDQLKNIINQ